MSTATPETDPLRGGELNQAITSAVVGIHTEFHGRGPRSASTFYHGNTVVTVMNGVLTRAEKVLHETGSSDAVSRVRHLYQAAIEEQLVAAVKRLTGCGVVGFVSGNALDPDVAVEVFILDRSL
jgi:uncharacterized protein YbcI